MLNEAIRRGWGYVRPNLGGPNRLPSSCLSPSVIENLDAVVDFCGKAWGVPPASIHIIGHSGGGFTALGYWHLGRRPVASVQAWNPITDLSTWHAFCNARPHLRKYAQDIESAIGGSIAEREEEAKLRSPLHMPIPVGPNLPRLRIFAGIRDGHEGSVPVTQSTAYIARLAAYGLTRGISPDITSSIHSGDIRLLAQFAKSDHTGFFAFESAKVEFYVFDGAHEMPIYKSWEILTNE